MASSQLRDRTGREDNDSPGEAFVRFVGATLELAQLLPRFAHRRHCDDGSGELTAAPAMTT
jgi:hypothetical protein